MSQHSTIERQETQRLRRRVLLLLLPFLPIMCAVFLCISQLAVNNAQIRELFVGVSAAETADYSPWENENFAPIKPALSTELAVENDEAISLSQLITQAPLPTEIDVNTVEETSTVAPTMTVETVETTQIVTLVDEPSETPINSPDATLTPTPSNTVTLTISPTPTLSETPSSVIAPPISTATAEPPVANFSAVANGLSVTITNLSSGSITSYSWSFGDGANSTLASPETYTYSSAGTYTILLTVEGIGGTSSFSLPVTVNTVSNDLVLSLSSNMSSINNNDFFVVTARLSNQSGQPAVNTFTNINIPSGLEFFSSSGNGTLVGSSWSVDSIASGATATINLTLRANAAGTVQTIQGQITAQSYNDTNLSNNTSNVAVTILADNTIDIQITEFSPSNTTPQEGDTITITLSIQNAGTATATNLIIGTSGDSGLINGIYNPTQGSVTNGVWSVGDLDPSSTATLVITATVNTGTAGTSITRTRSLQSVDQTDSNSSNDSDNLTLTILSPTDADLEFVVFTYDNLNPAIGDIITGTVSILNNGPATATNVVVSSAVGSGGFGTVQSFSVTHGTAPFSGEWTIPSLNSGETATLTIVVQINSSAAGTTFTRSREIIASDQPDPDSTPNNAVTTEDDYNTYTLIVQPAVDMNIAKVVDNPTPNAGDTIMYTLTASNNGGLAATGVIVNDLLPTGVTYVSSTPSQGTYTAGTGIWDIGALANGASTTLTINATVDTGTEGQSITNSANINSNEPDLNTSNNNASANVSVGGTFADLEFTTFTFNNLNPSVGDTITSTVSIVNNGPATATNIVLGDSFGSGALGAVQSTSLTHGTSNGNEWTIPSLNSGETATLTITLTVEPSAAGTTVTRWREIITSDQPDPDSTPNNGVTTEDDYNTYTVIVQQAVDLSITKSVDNATPSEGDTIEYLFNVTNNGPNVATSFTASDLLPTGVTLISTSYTGSGGTRSYDSVSDIWTVTTLANGQTSGLRLLVTVNAGTAGQTVDSITSVTASSLDLDMSNNSDSAPIVVAVNADMEVTVSSNNSNPAVGEGISITVRIQNNGPSTATNVQVNYLLPAGLTANSYIPSNGTYDPVTGIWNTIEGSMILNNIDFLTILATVNSGMEGQTITNSASVSTSATDSNTTNDTALDTIIVKPPEITDLVHTLLTVDNVNPNEGDIVNFDIRISNLGPDNATGIQVNSGIPLGLTYVSHSTVNGTYDQATGVWAVGALANGGSTVAVLSINAQVNVGTAGQTININSAINVFDQVDPDLSNNNASTSLTVQ